MRFITLALALASASFAGGPVVGIEDPLQKAHAIVGDLGDAGGGGLQVAARGWLAAKGARVRVPVPAASARADVQDGTPVRLVRFRDGEGPEVSVAFGEGMRVIGVAVSPGYPRPLAAASAPLPVGAGASLLGLASSPAAPAVAPDWGALKRGALGSTEGLRAFAEARAARSYDEVVRYGAAPRFDAIVGRLGLVVDEERTASGRALVGNAFYSSIDHALHFARKDAYPSAADPSIVAHEYGHAVWHALVGEEPVKPATPEQLGVYEGHADAFATLVTGDAVVGRAWLAANGDAPRDAVNDLTHGGAKAAEAHELGRVYSGFLHTLTAKLPRGDRRALVLGGLQLAPRPVTPASLVIGLLLVDRLWFGGARTEVILAEAARRGLPCGVKRAGGPSAR
jgi:hypothetical protein